MTDNKDALLIASECIRQSEEGNYERSLFRHSGEHLHRLVAENEVKDAALKSARGALEGWANHGKWVWPESALEQCKRNTTEALAQIDALAAKEQP